MTGLEGTYCLEKAFLHGPSYTHDFTGGLHLCGEGVVDFSGTQFLQLPPFRNSGLRQGSERARPCKFVEREAGHLCDDIVQRGFKAGRGVGQHDLVQGHAYADLG